MLLTVRPVWVQSVTLSPSTVAGGTRQVPTTVTGTVTLEAAASSGGVVVNINSSNTTVATVPKSITIAAGQQTGTFQIKTYKPASGSVTVQINAYTTGGPIKSAPLTVTQ